MPLAINYNAVFTVQRLTRDSVEDGTPIYTEAPVDISGWFDELETRTLEESFRKESIPYADRRAMFMCDATADIQQDDKGTVVVGTLNRGTWEVSVIRTAPTPTGPGHLEVQLQGTKEGK